jgi:flagellum-specific ATP synthase
MSAALDDTLTARVRKRLADARSAAAPTVTGEVVGAAGFTVEVAGLQAAVGELLIIDAATGPLPSEVVGLRGDRLLCLPLTNAGGLYVGAPTRVAGSALGVPVGSALLGRVLDALGNPLDGGPPLDAVPRVSAIGAPPHPLRRSRIAQPISLGVRALDTLCPLGRGQRVGLFAGSGVGKSSLLSMVARSAGTNGAADVTVLALVGERGREVREFLEDDLGPEGLARSVVVVATGDEPALLRLRAALAATRIAEHFRDSGLDVLLLLDSLTRVATAQREIGLGAGEPPTTRGYPPSVTPVLARLLERAGTAEVGTITAIYTVLVDGDDHNDPVADTARSILDGHVVLTRDLANAGHYPAVDVLASVSRCAPAITTPEQAELAVTARRLLAAHREAADLVAIGAYAAGSSPEVDRAIAVKPALDAFLRQSVHDSVPAETAWTALRQALGGAR